MNQKSIGKYNHTDIESRWQKVWAGTGLNKTDLSKAKNPYYNLMMYPYPSAEGLHVGNVYAFTGSDIHGRFMKMKGHDVFEPIGFDSGGIHSENFAIKIGVHPKKLITDNIKHFTQQLKMTGNMYDWEHTVDVMDPDYYRWTQWLFTQLFKAGLAYKKEAPVTWCTSCKTTVSDEQTEKKADVTVCERCKTPIERRNMKQWFFRITEYADRLLQNTFTLNWPNKILITQRNWIGKSQGAEVNFKVEHSEYSIKIFTTRPDTLHGCSFFCLAPEHPLVEEITTDNYRQEVADYLKITKRKTEQERKTTMKKKTGVFSGSYVLNPVNGERVPIWIADYVLMDYGEGAVMGVPMHDQRDFDFAIKYQLPLLSVIKPDDSSIILDNQTPYEGDGTLINSGGWNGWRYPQDLDKIIDWLENKQLGKRKTTFKLRDWCISRQRYWGPPIPMIYCPQCASEGKSWGDTPESLGLQSGSGKNKRQNGTSVAGWFPVPEKDLPVLLPMIEDYLPDGSGKSPLSRHQDFIDTTCPCCGGKAQRETDVSDTFLDSSWYFLRYPSTAGGDISQEVSQTHAFDPKITKKWLPVSQYCGGAEHSVLHLLYSRFINMALHDLDYLDFEEPFPNFFAHGLIIKDGSKMSKSRGNVVNPDEYIQKYGADVLRLYLSFIGPYSEGGDFRDSGIAGMQRFIRRVWKLVVLHIDAKASYASSDVSETMINKTIKKVTKGIERFKYNTAIAALMEFINYLEGVSRSEPNSYNEKKTTTEEISSNNKLALDTLLLLLAPFTPHITEDLWQKLHGWDENKPFVSIHTHSWPVYDEKKITSETLTIAVQVNGKLRTTIEIPSSWRVKIRILFLKASAKADQKVQKFIANQKLVREIVVPGKLVNLVTA